MAALLALALGLRVSPTVSAMPAIGTWLEPWYTARYNYHWSFAPEPACEGEQFTNTIVVQEPR